MNKFAILSILGVMTTLWFISTSPSSDSLLDTQFLEFINQYGVNYASEVEYDFRKEVFRSNLEKAAELAKLNPLARFGVTQFSDKTTEEMTQMMGDLNIDLPEQTDMYTETAEPNGDINWISHFRPIQNQGSCGSCWAFASTATYEAYVNIKEGDSTKYSEQELVDCVTQCSGCNGGLALYGWSWLNGKHYCTESEYSYQAKDETCKESAKCSKSKAAKSKGYKLISTNEKSILSQLKSGPVAISVDASIWGSYKGGILENGCGTSTNHAVVVNGFKDGSKPYWIIRNSWGEKWGEEGHMWLAYGQNVCNIEKRPCIPTF